MYICIFDGWEVKSVFLTPSELWIVDLKFLQTCENVKLLIWLTIAKALSQTRQGFSKQSITVIITHLVYLLRCDWSVPCHVVQFILMLLHATWCSRASFLELLPLARPGNSSRNDARQNVFLQFATGILVIKTAEKHVILKHIFKKHVLNVLHVLNEMVMVCYKTHVDWPYSGNSIRLFPPRARWSPPNQSISRGHLPSGAVNMCILFSPCTNSVWHSGSHPLRTMYFLESEYLWFFHYYYSGRDLPLYDLVLRGCTIFLISCQVKPVPWTRLTYWARTTFSPGRTRLGPVRCDQPAILLVLKLATSPSLSCSLNFPSDDYVYQDTFNLLRVVNIIFTGMSSFTQSI